MAFSIYKIVNKINGKVYIGITTKGEGRWKVHLNTVTSGPEIAKASYSYIHKAIAKYGKEHFDFIILDELPSLKELKEAEIATIKQYRENGCKLYNLTDGGDGHLGFKHSEESKIKMSNAAKSVRKLNPSKYAGENSPHAKLTTNQVVEIVDLYNSGLTILETSAKLNVSRDRVSQIINGKDWVHLNLKVNKRPFQEEILKNLNTRKGPIETISKTCQNCSVTFEVNVRQHSNSTFDSRKRNRKFCSSECKNQNLGKKNSARK